jgi:hypothetical protein
MSYIVGATLAVAQPKEGRPAHQSLGAGGEGELCWDTQGHERMIASNALGQLLQEVLGF